MSQRVIVLDEAEDELIQAQEWYETQRSGLGREFRSAIDEAIERLLQASLAASPILNLSPDIGVRQSSGRTLSVFDRLHLPRRGYLGRCICPSASAAGILA